jgi:hypothetical protein
MVICDAVNVRSTAAGGGAEIAHRHLHAPPYDESGLLCSVYLLLNVLLTPLDSPVAASRIVHFETIPLGHWLHRHLVSCRRYPGHQGVVDKSRQLDPVSTKPSRSVIKNLLRCHFRVRRMEESAGSVTYTLYVCLTKRSAGFEDDEEYRATSGSRRLRRTLVSNRLTGYWSDDYTPHHLNPRSQWVEKVVG